MDEEIKKEDQSLFAKPTNIQGETLDSKFTELEKKTEEYLNNWKRSAADFINYKKDEMERMANLMQYSKTDIIEKVLPIFDSIYLAQKCLKPDVKQDGIAKGIEQTIKQIQEFLKKEGIEEIVVVGQKFDPNTMEIVEEIEGGESGTVAEELQRGYMMGEKVLRPSKVKVSK